MFTHCTFVPSRDKRSRREEGHRKKCPNYPDPDYHLNSTQAYFFRHPDLRHLRIEQYQRYLATSANAGATEDTVDDPDEVPADTAHRHYDEVMERTSAGQRYASLAAHVAGARRRKQSQLCVSRLPFIECLGATREAYYEKQLLTTFPWYCSEGPTGEEGAWRFYWSPPPPDKLGGAVLEPIQLKIESDGSNVSFEERCRHLEDELCKTAHGLI